MKSQNNTEPEKTKTGVAFTLATGKWIVAIIFLVLFAGSYAFVYIDDKIHYDPQKIVDPRNPEFDPLAFSFKDYHSREEMLNFIETVFPAGTSRERIDKIIAEIGGASVREIEDNVYSYKHKAFTGKVFGVCTYKPQWYITLKFNKGNKLDKLVQLRGPCA